MPKIIERIYIYQMSSSYKLISIILLEADNF